ncbi:MAG: O-antigen ligase family protein [Gammaproteobacteria bacterium]|nr:O-antigen ligase family protein [Gammaproteobacteria bacterium]
MSVAIYRWFSEISSRPLELLIGLCLFATAASGGAIASVASTSLAILFITSLFYSHKWPGLWNALARNEKLLLAGLGLYAFSGLISYYNVADQQEFIKHMGRYIRFLLIVPVYLLLTRDRGQWFKYLVAGAVVCGPLYLTFALISISENPGMPASGHYHWITFGDAAMLNIVYLSAVLVTSKLRMMLKIIMVISIVCALYASFLSQARGAWLALPFCGALLAYMMLRDNKLKMKIVLPVVLLIIIATGISPAGDIIGSRVTQAKHEIELFASGEKFDSSVGARLAMWDIALDVWRQHPVIGTGLGDFDQEIELRQSQGVYKNIELHASVHNIYFQALATTGTVGFLMLFFALVIQPLRIFYQASRDEFTPAQLGGLVVIVAYAVFGLTESWMLRAPVVSIYLVYLITLSVSVSAGRRSGDKVQC